MTDQDHGLYNRYTLENADGTERDPAGVYLVLKLNNKDSIHAEASQEAMVTYAKSIQAELPELAADIIMLVSQVRRGEDMLSQTVF